MRIAINCRSFLNPEPAGIGRYAYHLVRSLSALDTRNEYQLYARKGLFHFGKKLPDFKARNFTARLDYFNRGPARMLKGMDVFHLPSPGPLEDVPAGAKIVVTVHDVIVKSFPEGHTPTTIAAGERQLEDICQRADKIICCSQSTVDDLHLFFTVPPERVTRIYQGVDKELFYRIDGDEAALAQQALKQHGIAEPFILSVGTLEPRKNLINVLRAFQRLRTGGTFTGKLAVIGMKGWMQENIGDRVRKLGLDGQVVFLGYMPDRELRWFYNKAAAFVFPSLYEGFGFPIVEAFACGAPVVTSNISSCPEVAGDAALTVDPNRPEAIAGAVERILGDASLREQLREKGLARARDFDFTQTARETLKVYEEVGGLS